MSLRQVYAAIIIAIGIQSSAVAQDYSYGVEGYNGDTDSYVYGEVEAWRDDRQVEGYIYDEESGEERYFEGEWTGYGEIEGYDEDGNYIYLETQ